MIQHVHWRRSGEMKLIIEITLTSEQETTIYWNKLVAWFKGGPRALQLSIGKSESVSMERRST